MVNLKVSETFSEKKAEAVAQCREPGFNHRTKKFKLEK